MQQLRDLVKFAIDGNVFAVANILQESIQLDVYMLNANGKINILHFTPLHIICYSLIGANQIKQIMALALILTHGFDNKLTDKQGRYALDLLPEKYKDNFKLFLVLSQQANQSMRLAIREDILDNYFILNETNDLKTIYEIECFVRNLIGYKSKSILCSNNKRVKLSF